METWGPSIMPYTLLLLGGVVLYPRLDGTQARLLVCLATSFLLPWLIFSNLYLIHDYYQLPVAVMLALFLAGSGSLLCRYVANSGRLGRWIVIALTVTFVLNQCFLLLVAPFSDRARASAWTAMELLIADNTLVLVVGDASLNTPVAGGKLGRRTVTITPPQLESNCDAYLRQYKAIVALYESACLVENKSTAESFFRSSIGMLRVRN
jgi:hypothetical protein